VEVLGTDGVRHLVTIDGAGGTVTGNTVAPATSDTASCRRAAGPRVRRGPPSARGGRRLGAANAQRHGPTQPAPEAHSYLGSQLPRPEGNP
ncbi:hypothetical protein ACFWIZ_44410, partial [Streptomyces sp. NPDC127044]